MNRKIAPPDPHAPLSGHPRSKPASRPPIKTIDVHIHFLSPRAIEGARKAPDRYGVRVLDDGPRPRLAVGAEPPTRPLLEALYTLDRHLEFLDGQGIDTALFGPLMDVAGYSLPTEQGAAWSRLHAAPCSVGSE